MSGIVIVSPSQLGKKQLDLLKPAPARMDQLNNTPSAEKTNQALSIKPLPSTPVPAIPTPTPQFKFVALINLNVSTSTIVNWVLSEKVYLLIKELLALPVEAQAAASHTVSTYLMDMNHGHHSADTTTLDDWGYIGQHNHSQGIINSSCQVVIICRDMWERLGTPMKHKQVMFMESATGKSNVTMGMIPSICFSIGEVSLYCSVQVVRNAPFQCLPGLPFTSLCQPSAMSFWMGVHTFYLPTQTQEPPLQFQLTLNSPPSVVSHPVVRATL